MWICNHDCDFTVILDSVSEHVTAGYLSCTVVGLSWMAQW